MRNISLLTPIIIFILLAISNGCSRRGSKEILAQIDDKFVITFDDFEYRISQLPERYQDIIRKRRDEFLDELIIDLLLYKEALKRRLDRDKDVKAVIEEAKKKILIARLLKEEVEDEVTIGEDEIKKFYEENEHRYAEPEVLRASHILVKTENEARDILARLKSGEKFEKLAEAYSLDPTGKIGGDIGYFTRGQLVPKFEDACLKLKVGEISGIVKTKFGYHIIKLTERKDARLKELSEVKDAIEQTLKRRKKKILFNKFVEKLKKDSKIVINRTLLESSHKDKE